MNFATFFPTFHKLLGFAYLLDKIAVVDLREMSAKMSHDLEICFK